MAGWFQGNIHLFVEDAEVLVDALRRKFVISHF